MPTNRSRAGGRLAVVVVLSAIAAGLLLAPQAGAYYTVVGDLTTVTGQAPHSIATDSSGNVYVTATFTEGVHKFAPSGTQLTFWGGPGTADGKFGDPRGIAASTACACIYVLDGISGGGTDRIQKFDPSGAFLGKWGSFGTADDQFNAPEGVATDAAGNVYVTDFVGPDDGYRIKKYDGNGNFITKWGTTGVAPSEFEGLVDVAVSGSSLYAIDGSNQRVSQWSLTGDFVGAWGSGQGPGSSQDGMFASPEGIATDAGGNVWVADRANNRVQEFDSTGTFLAKVGVFGNGPGKFSSPRDVAVGADGYLYVVDAGNSRVEALAPTAPGTVIDSAPTVTSDRTPTLTFHADTPNAAPGQKAPGFQCSLVSAGFVPSFQNCAGPAGTHTPDSDLADGTYNFAVRATDSGGPDPTPATATFTVDAVPPTLSITGGPNGLTNNRRPTFSFDAEAGTMVDCSIATGTPTFSSCLGAAGTHTPAAGLPDGSYTFWVRAMDSGGQTIQMRNFSVDGTAPPLAITSGPSGPTNSNRPTFSFSAEAGASVDCVIITGTGIPINPPYSSCVGPAGTHTPAANLADNTYTFLVRATDAAGNSTTQTRSFTVDTVAPTAGIISGPSGPTSDNTPTFQYGLSIGAASFECSIDHGTPTFGSCVGLDGTHTPAAALSDGAYTFRIRVSDAAGNSSVATRDFSVDATPPTVSITGGPSGPTTNNHPTFDFNVAGATMVSCSISSPTASFGPCSGGSSHTPPAALPDGTYVFEVKAVDALGNTSTAARPFSIDTTAPAAPTLTATAPASPANDNNPVVIGEAESGSTVRLFTTADCSGDPVATGSAAELASPGLPASVADNTTTEFRATATDALNNRSACSAAVGYTEDSTPARDLTPPQVTITSGPKGLVQGSKATFTFTATELVSFLCKLDEQPYKVCTSPKTFRHLAPGKHKLLVSALDIGFNFDLTPESRSWRVAPR